MPLETYAKCRRVCRHLLMCDGGRRPRRAAHSPGECVSAGTANGDTCGVDIRRQHDWACGLADRRTIVGLTYAGRRNLARRTCDPSCSRRSGVRRNRATPLDGENATDEAHRPRPAQALAPYCTREVKNALCDERDALVTWPTTAPTTRAGVLATLEHASHRPCLDIECAPDDLTNLVESVHSSNDILEAGERFAEMIAAGPCAADQPAATADTQCVRTNLCRDRMLHLSSFATRCGKSRSTKIFCLPRGRERRPGAARWARLRKAG
jgi:hypothetical protein